MTDLSWAEIKRRVHKRANFRCEYCLTPQKATGQAMHVEQNTLSQIMNQLRIVEARTIWIIAGIHPPF